MGEHNFGRIARLTAGFHTVTVYRFNDYELDTSSYGLTRKGEPIEVEPKVFDLLRYLIEHHDNPGTACRSANAATSSRTQQSARPAETR